MFLKVLKLFENLKGFLPLASCNIIINFTQLQYYFDIIGELNI